MIGLGTAINIGLIIAGSLCGLAFGRFMKENLKQTLMMVSGIIVLLLGMSGAMQYMLVIVNGTLQTTGPMLMIISMVAGAVIGELIDLNRWITVFGDWVKAKTGNTGDPQFTHAFITASLTFTVGAMGVLGSIQDGLTGNYQTLLLKRHPRRHHRYGYGILYGQGRVVFLYSCGNYPMDYYSYGSYRCAVNDAECYR